MKEIVDIAKKKKKEVCVCEGFQDKDLESQELIDTTPQERTEDNLMEMSASNQVSGRR